MGLFQAGRLSAYALAGALAAHAAHNLAWLSTQTGALRPVWTFFHVAVLMWGLSLLLWARQPVWVDAWGHRFWRQFKPRVEGTRWVFLAGAAWALMPCGLLYSALLVASLSGGAADGALSMAMFALGSGVTLAIGPWLWVRLSLWRNPARQAWSMRAAGTVLSAVAAWALSHDLDPRLADYCKSLLAL